MKIWIRRSCVLLVLLSLLTVSVFADMGPKPSVNLTIRGFKTTNYYVTLLSEDESTGPYSWVGFGEFSSEPPTENADIWQAFVDYQDEDGFYFLQYFENPTTHEDRVGLYEQFTWDYYPPDTFKVLLYIPADAPGEGTFWISEEIVETYAFDSYFEVTPTEYGEPTLHVERTYGYGWELFAFLVRLGLTIVIELFLAYAFGFKTKNQLLIILGINTVTQLALNIGLQVGGYQSMFLFYCIYYGLWETLIFAVEAGVYKLTLQKADEPYAGKKRPVLYAFVANACSFVMGFVISQLFPFVF